MRRVPAAMAVLCGLLAILPPVPGAAQDRDTATAARAAGDDIEELRARAMRGDAAAQYRLGQIYRGGIGVPKDLKAAATFFVLAARQSYVYAQLAAGHVYENGEGVPRDVAAAADWYERAAQQGSAAAQARLGFMYADGEGVARDRAAAADWLRKAAEQDFPPAMMMLGVLLMQGGDVPQDFAGAYTWFALTAIRARTLNGTWRNYPVAMDKLADAADAYRRKLSDLLPSWQRDRAEDRIGEWKKTFEAMAAEHAAGK